MASAVIALYLSSAAVGECHFNNFQKALRRLLPVVKRYIFLASSYSSGEMDMSLQFIKNSATLVQVSPTMPGNSIVFEIIQWIGLICKVSISK